MDTDWKGRKLFQEKKMAKFREWSVLVTLLWTISMETRNFIFGCSVKFTQNAVLLSCTVSTSPIHYCSSVFWIPWLLVTPTRYYTVRYSVVLVPSCTRVHRCHVTVGLQWRFMDTFPPTVGRWEYTSPTFYWWWSFFLAEIFLAIAVWIGLAQRLFPVQRIKVC